MVYSLVLSTHTQSQQRQPQTVDHFVVLNTNVTDGIWHWHLLQFLSRGPRIKTSSGQIQTSQLDPSSFTSNISKGRSRQTPDPAKANSASHNQHLHNSLYSMVGVNSHSHPAWELTTHMNMQTVIKILLQQKSPYNPWKKYSYSNQMRWSRKLLLGLTWQLQYKDTIKTGSNSSSIIHRNKHKESRNGETKKHVLNERT